MTGETTRADHRTIMNDQEAVIEVVRRLPDSITMEDINQELATLIAIRRGISAADKGQTKSHEEVKRLLVQWTTR